MTRLDTNAHVDAGVLVYQGRPIAAGEPMDSASTLTGSDYVQAYYRAGDQIPKDVRDYLESNPTPDMHSITLTDPTRAARLRKPGRPPAGRNGTEVRSYPRVRLEHDLRDTVRQLARDNGEALHVTLARLVELGLRA